MFCGLAQFESFVGGTRNKSHSVVTSNWVSSFSHFWAVKIYQFNNITMFMKRKGIYHAEELIMYFL